MSVDILMPNLGFDAQEGRIVEWLKQPGDPIRKGEAIAIIESDKANVELESLADGVVLEQRYPAGEMAPLGAVIARVGSAAERTAAPAKADQAPTPESVSISPVARRLAEENGIDLARVAGSGNGGRIMRQDVEAAIKASAPLSAPPGQVLALPKVRKAAREAGIDLKVIQPTGAHGQITLADIREYQQRGQPTAPAVPAPSMAPQAAAPDGRREVLLSRIRQAIGQRLSKSMQEAPHFYVSGEFDLENALANLNRLPEPRPRINDLLQYLTVEALRAAPALNATYESGHLYQQDSIHLAVAVALEDGLITPVIPHAERYSLVGLAAESRALVERARAGRLRLQDLSAGTFTISNLGIYKQVNQFTAVINPPQVAILAVGTARQRPVVIDGGLHIRHTVTLTLSGDHRVVDGAHLGQFMAAFQSALDGFARQPAK